MSLSENDFERSEDDFERLCRKPLELFVGELCQRLQGAYPKLNEAEPHFFRIQRDTRFAKDKSPYKTNIGANMSIRPPDEGEDQHTTPGVYLSFGLDGELVAWAPATCRPSSWRATAGC
jgi:uncharacterized protein (DUF2461 family)